MTPDIAPANLSPGSDLYRGGIQTGDQQKAHQTAMDAARIPLDTEINKSVSPEELVALRKAFDKNDLQANVEPGSRGEKERVRDAYKALG
jgi:hypothetical protein